MEITKTIVINGKAITGAAISRWSGDVPYVHLTAIFNLLGGSTVWQARENQAVVTWRGNMLLVPSTGQTMTLNGEKRSIAHPSFTSDGKLYVALPSLAQAFGGVYSDSETELSLYIPAGRLAALNLAASSLILQWTGNTSVEVLPDNSIALHGTSLPEGLEAIKVARAPLGHTVVTLEATGAVEPALGEQSMRLAWKKSNRPLEGLTIALDAGHGGQQSGAVSHSGRLEKDLTRTVVDKLNLLLSQAGAKVVDVRPLDETVSLKERVDRTRQGRAKAFVSVHYNAFERIEANGTETFHATGNVEARKLALLVHGELVQSLRLRDRGVKQAAFHVIHALNEIPAVLVEVGFITNPSEEAYLLEESTVEKTAESIARGILAYFNQS